MPQNKPMVDNKTAVAGSLLTQFDLLCGTKLQQSSTSSCAAGSVAAGWMQSCLTAASLTKQRNAS